LRLYAESSAILAWLLGEPEGDDLYQFLRSAEGVVTSDLTLVECDRRIARLAATGELSEAEAATLRGELSIAAPRWSVLRVAPAIIERARHRFPKEPVRSLDAIHLAAALAARAAAPDLILLSLDDHLRANARALGFELRPK
jgi:predicted nucleic acid-binding protein